MIKHTITDIAYKFHAAGVIVPILQITPGIEIKDKIINTVYLVDKTVMTKPINRNDVVELDIDDIGNITKISSMIKGELNHQLKTEECPVCNTKLLHSSLGVGQCINKNCKAQLPKNILRLLSGLNFPFRSNYNRILDNLFIRGAFHSLEHLFHIKVDDFAFSNISIPDACGFLTDLHKLRGNTSLEQLLIGLDMSFTYETIQRISNIFVTNGLRLNQSYLLADPKFLKEHNIISTQWENFIAIPDNVNNLSMLGYLLDH